MSTNKGGRPKRSGAPLVRLGVSVSPEAVRAIEDFSILYHCSLSQALERVVLLTWAGLPAFDHATVSRVRGCRDFVNDGSTERIRAAVAQESNHG